VLFSTFSRTRLDAIASNASAAAGNTTTVADAYTSTI